MTKAELVALVRRGLLTLADEFNNDNFVDAAEQAERDCGWLLPQTDAFKVKWLIARTKRHLFQIYIEGELGGDFQYEQVHLEHPFDHYHTLIQDNDTAFKEAMEENPLLFADIDPYKMFGTKIDAGFQYNEIGEDTTYDEDNEIIFQPTEAD